jgi:Rx N-terminal domain
LAPSCSSSNNNSENERHALEENLEQIKLSLYDAEEREIRDNSVKLWLKELKRVGWYEVARVQVEARKDFQASGSQEKANGGECLVCCA